MGTGDEHYDGVLSQAKKRPGNEHKDIGNARFMGNYADRRVQRL